MSWFPSSLTQSVTGKISQIGGQLKDIITETTEDIEDPNAELKVLYDKLKEKEKHIEFLNVECTRWQEEANETNVKCKTFEAQLEKSQSEFRQQLLSKESQIIELRNQLNSSTSAHTDTSSFGYQKSSLMEEFEEVMPSSDLNDYIHLQKEIKRLKEDNTHLMSENRDLLNKVKTLKLTSSGNAAGESSSSAADDDMVHDEKTINELKQEIFSLKNRLEQDKDKHQHEIVAIQENYKQKLTLTNAYEEEIDLLKKKIQQLEADLEKFKSEKKEEETTTSSAAIPSSSKSDDGWCLNGEEVKDIDLEVKNTEHFEILIKEKTEEIEQLKAQVETFESDLEQANSIILKLKNSSRSNSKSPPSSQLTPLGVAATSAADDLTANVKQKELEINELKAQLQISTEQTASKLNELESQLGNAHSKLKEKETQLEEYEKQLDSLQLDLKQQQQSIQQEKMLQMQEHKQEKQEMGRLRSENTELKIKLEEKLSEISQLGDQINDLNSNINTLKSNDSTLFSELQTKTEQFLHQLDAANAEITSLKSEREKLVDNRRQFEFVLDEKTRECSQLKADLQKHLQHIAAQSKAIDKLQFDLKETEISNQEPTATTTTTSVVNKAETTSEQSSGEEMAALKAQYNQLYSYLEQKNQESLGYYNEIQRLNEVVSELNRELFNLKSVNENLSEQYDTVLKEFQLEQKMVEDLNQQTAELTNTLLSTTSAFKQNDDEVSTSQELSEMLIRENETKYLAIITDLEQKLDDLAATKQEKRAGDDNQDQYLQKIGHLESQLNDLRREKSEIIESKEESEKKYFQVIADLEQTLDDLVKEKEEMIQQQFRGSEGSQIASETVQQLEQKVSELVREKNELMERAEASRQEMERTHLESIEHLQLSVQNLTLEKDRAVEQSHRSDEAKLGEKIQSLQQQIDDLTREKEEIVEKSQRTSESLSRENEAKFANLQQQVNDLIREKGEILEQSQRFSENLSREIESKYLEAIQSLEQRIGDLSREKSEILQRGEGLSEVLRQEMEKKYLDVIQGVQQRADDLVKEKSDLVEHNQAQVNDLNGKLTYLQGYYENLIKNENENFKIVLQNEEQQRAKLSKELERLREHLVEMSENYTKEAIQAEDREKQLRTSLNEAQTAVQQQGASMENFNKDIEVRLDQMTQQNQDLKSEREKLREKIKQTEESLSHQIKVVKNLELVLERVQNEKDGQYSLEIAKYQQTIKEQAVNIHNQQVDAQNYQRKIDELKEQLDARGKLELQMLKKDEQLKSLQAQISTKDVLIESLDKRVNDIQKVNDSYIEKEIIKNVIIGYIKVNQAQEKKQVLKLLSTMLDFSANELEQIENSNEQGKWFNLLKGSPKPGAKSLAISGGGNESLNKSFTELLIQYVDRESKPKANLKFDINNPSLLQTNKKTDNPLLLNSQEIDLNSSESAIKFFNNSLISSSGSSTSSGVVTNSLDLNLVNRAQSQQQQQQQQAQPVNSDVNSILEQILK